MYGGSQTVKHRPENQRRDMRVPDFWSRRKHLRSFLNSVPESSVPFGGPVSIYGFRRLKAAVCCRPYDVSGISDGAGSLLK